jgi:hypothetical protein
MEVGEVATAGFLSRFRLTNPGHVLREIVGETDPGNADCSDPARIFPPSSQQKDPQTNAPTNVGCYYYVNVANYLITRAAYTTGHISNWDVFGTSSFQTETGYDNRYIDPSSGGLKGVVSMVHPRLFTAYLVESPAGPSGGAINRTWGSARLRRMDFHFLPEPAGITMLAAGFVTLAGLYRIRRR